jgi:uncharacterized membrane protein (GlpM family)
MKLITDFIIGGTVVALASYLVKSKETGVKYAAVITHGIPTAFLVTLFLIYSKDKQRSFISEGIKVTSILLLLLGILYYLSKNWGMTQSLIAIIILWLIIMSIYTK